MLDPGEEIVKESIQDIEQVGIQSDTPSITTEIAVDESGNRYRLFNGTKILICVGFSRLGKPCSAPRVGGSQYCVRHSLSSKVDQSTNLPTDFTRELRVLKKLLSVLNCRNGTLPDAKLLNKVTDLITLVSRLNEKFTNTLVISQLKQLGFYFGSILFNYIQDGNRYELAKKDFLDAIKKMELFDTKEFESRLQ